MIGRLIAAIPLPYKLLLGGLIIAAITSGLWWVHHSIWSDGYDACELAYDEAMQIAKDKARARVIESERAYEEILRQINAAPDSGQLVGPVTAAAIDSLP